VKPALWLPLVSVVTSNSAEDEELGAVLGAMVGVAVADVVGTDAGAPLLPPPPQAASVTTSANPASKAARCILK